MTASPSDLLYLKNRVLQARQSVPPDSAPELLAALVLVAALKGVEAASLEHPGKSEIKAIRSLSDLSLESWQSAAQEVYVRLKAVCAPEIARSLPPPDDIRLLEMARQIVLDPRLSAQWSSAPTLGNIYQYFAAPTRKASQKSIQSANKVMTLESLIAFTQLYTPLWVIDFLNQNAILPQWSGLASHSSDFQYLLPGSGNLSSLDAPQFRVIDPCCGSGHFLIGLVDLLMSLHAAEGRPPCESVVPILGTQVFGVDVDRTALWVAAVSLWLKAIQTGASGGVPQLKLSDTHRSAKEPSALGSLDPSLADQAGHPLAGRYHAVVTNPPYIGRKLMDRHLKGQLKEIYPLSHQDLCAAFIERGLDLLHPAGRLGFITQASLMFLPTYGKLRKKILETRNLRTLVDCGPGVFPLQGGEKVNSALIVIEARQDTTSPVPAKTAEAPVTFIDITGSRAKEEALKSAIVDRGRQSVIDAAVLNSYRHCSFNHRCPPPVLEFAARCPRLHMLAEVRQGLATGNNSRFVRYWWEVDPEEIGSRWVPYVKGAGGDRWYAPVHHVVDWQDEGRAIKQSVAESYPYLKGKTAWVVKNERFYFQEGLTFSFVSTSTLALRRLPAGCIFDVAGSALFAEDEKIDFLLAYLNSSFIRAIAASFNPTVNFQVGDLKELPLVDLPPASCEELNQLGKECYQLARTLCRFDETSLDTVIPTEIAAIAAGGEPGAIWARYFEDMTQTMVNLCKREARIDNLVRDAVLNELYATGDDGDYIRKWAEGTNGRARTVLPYPSHEEEFARSVVYYLFARFLDSSPTERSGKTSCANQPRNLCRPVLCADNDPQDIAKLLGLSSRQANWLGERLGEPLHAYVRKSFTQDHSRRMKNSPRFVISPVAGENALLLVSSAAMHNLRKRLVAGSLLPHDAMANGSSAALKAAHALLACPDFTGRQFHEAMQEALQ